MNSRGFSLVEVLVAGFIFLTCSMMMVQLLKAGMNFADQAAVLRRDTLALRSEMEELRATPAAELLSYNGQTFAGGEGRVIIASVSSNLLSLDLRLRGLEISTMRSLL